MTRRPTLIVTLTTTVGLMLSGCGQPTAQIVQPDEGRISYEVPIGYTDLENDQPFGQLYGPSPETRNGGVEDEPVVALASIPMGSGASFASLRRLSTGNEFDPRDPELDPLPNNTRLLGYTEIVEPEVWGVRVRLLVEQQASDFQALVDRQTGDVAFSSITCTLACFLEQTDVIDEIQGSWSLEP